MAQDWSTVVWGYLAMILMGSIFLASSVGAETQPIPVQSRTITVVTGDWPPYLIRSDPHQSPMGQVTDRVFNDAGYEVRYTIQPWKRSKDQVRAGAADVLMPAYCSPDRTAVYLCSDPVVTGKQVLFHRTDMPFTWTSVDDLRGYIIGGTLGYYYGTDFEAAERRGELKILRIASDETNMRLLMKGRIQLYPQDKAVGFAMLHNLYPPDRWSEITNDEKPLHEQSLHLLFTRASPRGAQLQSIFNQGLKHLRHTGKLSKIMSDLTRRNEIMPVRRDEADAIEAHLSHNTPSEQRVTPRPSVDDPSLNPLKGN